MTGFCTYGNESFGSVKGNEFAECLKDCYLLKRLLHACGGIDCALHAHSVSPVVCCRLVKLCSNAEVFLWAGLISL